MDKNSVDKLLKSFLENNNKKLSALNKENAALGDAMSTLFQAISKKYGQGEVTKENVIIPIKEKVKKRLTIDDFKKLPIGTKIAIPTSKQGSISAAENDYSYSKKNSRRGSDVGKELDFYYFNGFEYKNDKVIFLWAILDPNNGNYYDIEKDELYLYEDTNQEIEENIKVNTNKWRLPTVEEFKNILYPNKDMIPNLKNNKGYWSSIEDGDKDNFAWRFDFYNDAGTYNKDWVYYVRPVRDISSNSTNSANSTIIGNLEVWNTDLSEMNWNDAMKTVEEFNNTQTDLAPQTKTAKPLSYAELKALGVGTKIKIPESTGSPNISIDDAKLAVVIMVKRIAEKLNIKTEEVKWFKILAFDDSDKTIEVDRVDENDNVIDYVYIWTEGVDVYLYDENATTQSTSTTNKKYKPFDVSLLPNDGFAIKVNEDAKLAYNVVENLYLAGFSWASDNNGVYTEEQKKEPIGTGATVKWIEVGAGSGDKRITYSPLSVPTSKESLKQYEFNANGDLVPYNATTSNKKSTSQPSSTAQPTTSKPLSYAELKALGIGTKIRIPEHNGYDKYTKDKQKKQKDDVTNNVKQIADELKIKPEEVQWVEIVKFYNRDNSLLVSRRDENGNTTIDFLLWPDNVDIYLYDENETSQPTSTTNALPDVKGKLSPWTPDFKTRGFRPSPQRSAAQSTLNEYGAGFDSSIYRVIQDQRGVQKWKRQPYLAGLRPDLLDKKEDLFVAYDIAKHNSVNDDRANDVLKRIVELNIQLP